MENALRRQAAALHRIPTGAITQDVSGLTLTFHGHYTRQESLVIPGRVHVVTMLREPRSRLISQYRFHRALIRDRAATGKDILVAKSALAFKDYLSDPEVRAHTGVNNSATRNLFSLDSTIPESLRLAAAAEYEQGQLRPAIAVAIACAALDSMSWVTTTEQLNATASSLGPRLGLDLDLSRLKIPLMVTDNMSREAPDRFAPTERIDLDDETEDLMDELIAMDRTVYRHVQLKAPLPC